MNTWRCPTCLTVLLESTAKRCPGCHAKLRTRRGRPIVLGETSRLDEEATLPVDRRSRQRLGRGHWNPERPAQMPEAYRRAEVEPTPARAPEPEPAKWFDEPVPYPIFEPVAVDDVVNEAEPEPEPVAAPSSLDRALAEHVRKPAPASGNLSPWNIKRRGGDEI